jgi:hypothetical protein
MTDVIRADKRILVSEVLVEGLGALLLHEAQFIESGSRYWVAEDRGSLVVETETGERREVPGEWETRCI